LFSTAKKVKKKTRKEQKNLKFIPQKSEAYTQNNIKMNCGETGCKKFVDSTGKVTSVV
jgi:hypothetical protein